MPALTNAKHELFAQAVAKGKTADEAYVEAGYKQNRHNAASLGREQHILTRIAEIQGRAASRTEITAARVLEELWAIATADPNELVQFRRGACKDCWRDDLPPEASTPLDAPPNPDCTACAGEGMGRAFVADTRNLTGSARKLYAGVKITKDGIEVKMHDKAAALVNVGRHLGMFKDKLELDALVTDDARKLTREQLIAIATGGRAGATEA